MNNADRELDAIETVKHCSKKNFHFSMAMITREKATSHEWTESEVQEKRSVVHEKYKRENKKKGHAEGAQRAQRRTRSIHKTRNKQRGPV